MKVINKQLNESYYDEGNVFWEIFQVGMVVLEWG